MESTWQEIQCCWIVLDVAFSCRNNSLPLCWHNAMVQWSDKREWAGVSKTHTDHGSHFMFLMKEICTFAPSAELWRNYKQYLFILRFLALTHLLLLPWRSAGVVFQKKKHNTELCSTVQTDYLWRRPCPSMWWTLWWPECHQSCLQPSAGWGCPAPHHIHPSAAAAWREPPLLERQPPARSYSGETRERLL